MRWLALLLLALIAAVQAPLWFGKGGWLEVRRLELQVGDTKARNEKLKLRNDALRAEVTDLKAGQAAIEEAARANLGMIKQDEVFFQVVEAGKPASGKVATVPAQH